LGTFVWRTGNVVLGLLSFGVVGFELGAPGVRSGLGLGRCQFLACFWPTAGPGSLYLLGVGSVGHDVLSRRVRRGSTWGGLWWFLVFPRHVSII